MAFISKTYFAVEKFSCLDKIWHKICFTCEVCNLKLTMKTYKGVSYRMNVLPSTRWFKNDFQNCVHQELNQIQRRRGPRVSALLIRTLLKILLNYTNSINQWDAISVCLIVDRPSSFQEKHVASNLCRVHSADFTQMWYQISYYKDIWPADRGAFAVTITDGHSFVFFESN